MRHRGSSSHACTPLPQANAGVWGTKERIHGTPDKHDASAYGLVAAPHVGATRSVARMGRGSDVCRIVRRRVGAVPARGWVASTGLRLRREYSKQSTRNRFE